jgi:hypothetical protein
MGGVGSELFFDQVDYQLSDFATEDKEEIFKYTTFNRKGTHISNYAVWRFMENGKDVDSVQRQIIRRTQSIKMTDDGIRRHFVQCVSRSCEERMISLKTPNLFHALAKCCKAPFVRDDIKLLTSQEWAVIEKDVRSENGKRRNEGTVCSVANQMELERGKKVTLKEAATELGRKAGKANLGKPKSGSTEFFVTEEVNPVDKTPLSEKGSRFANTKRKATAQLVFEGIACSFKSCNCYMNSWTKEANDTESKTIFIQGKKTQRKNCGSLPSLLKSLKTLP